MIYSFWVEKRGSSLRIFLTKWFLRFASKEDIDENSLCETVGRAERGQSDADLGGGVIKQRITRTGEGKSGGFRPIILYQAGERAFFLYGFGKNDRDNISKDELRAFKELAREMPNYADVRIRSAVWDKTLIEVNCSEQNL